jgi:hypothetical protein
MAKEQEIEVMYWIFSILLVAVVWLSLFIGLKVVAIYRDAEEKYATSARKFYVWAERLAASERMPEAGLDLLSDMNSTINRRYAAIALARALSDVSKNPKMGAREPLDMPEKLLHGIREAYDHWRAAVKSRAPIFGLFARIFEKEQEYGPVLKRVSRRLNRQRHLIRA